MSANQPFTKENLDLYLKELSKEFRKRNGKTISAEIILIGGASVLVNYGFRELTYDVDAIIQSSGAMKDAINVVGDKLGLPVGWLNTDFMHTNSYTPNLVRYSKYYKTFSNIVQVRSVSAEYLVAMKLMAGRQYKNDLSDVVGILVEQEERGDAFSFERIKKAVTELYGDYEKLPAFSRNFIESLFEKEDLKDFYRQCRQTEIENKDTLVSFKDDYPGVLSTDNLEAVLKAAREKKKQTKTYSFYGWQHADVPAVAEEYKQINNPRHLYDLLSQIWCEYTCAPRMRESWKKDNMTLGQCSITAFLAQDIFGGEVYGILRPGGNYHCYNVVGDCVFDLTSEQFQGEELCYENNPVQSRETHFGKEEKYLRYKYLKEELKKCLEGK